MGLKTDITSLGAIGLGTAVAVVGTAGVLIAGAAHQAGKHAANCVDIDVARFDVGEFGDLAGLAELAEAPEAPVVPGAVSATVIVSSDVRVDIGECADVRAVVEMTRERAQEARSQARRAREQAEEVRARAEAIRIEVEAVREAAVAEATRR